MNLGLSFADDLTTVVDNLRPVTLTTDQAVPVEALSTELRTSEVAASAGRYQAGDSRFHVQANAFRVARPPRPGDSLTTDDGTIMTVLEANLQTLGTRYALVCRRLSIVGTQTTVTIQRATYTRGTSGAMEVSGWETLLTGVTAWIRPRSRDDQGETGQRVLKPTFTVYLLMPSLRPEAHWRILGPDGAAYKITGVSGEQRLDQLTEVTAEDHRWPSA